MRIECHCAIAPPTTPPLLIFGLCPPDLRGKPKKHGQHQQLQVTTMDDVHSIPGMVNMIIAAIRNGLETRQFTCVEVCEVSFP